VTVQKVFKQKWKNENTKRQLFFSLEALHRSSEEQDAMLTHTNKIETEHLERILPQLLLDF
ncbi:hypothetical protein INT48_007325, partial [Thamnidium elegans]